MLSKKVIEEIKSKVDIVDVVSRYVSLQKVGNNYRALCPFHTETTPSFYVNPSFKTYHCFGCGASGDVIKFLQEIEGISFIEALRRLAKEAGVKIELEDSSSFHTLYLKFYTLLNEEYKKNLTDVAISYLKNRGFSESEIEKYEFGFSPIDSDLPFKIARELNINSLRKLGFLHGKDPFSGRLIIPIKDEYGRVIAFGGRVLGEGQPKYINSYETDFFKKSSTLFLLDVAKDKIKSADFAIICEGYFDAIAFHRAGLTNSVATLGTAFTKYHARKIRKLTQNVVLSFDTDSAGIKAALLSLKILLSQNFNVMVVMYEGEKDPDEILKLKGSSELVDVVKSAIPAEVFVPKALSKKYDLKNSNAINMYLGELKQWDEVFKLVPKRQENFRNTIKEILGYDFDFSKSLSYKIREATKLPTLEDMLVYLYLNFPERFENIEVDLELLKGEAREFFTYVKNENFSFERLSKDLSEYINRVLKKLENTEIDEIYIETIERKLLERSLERRIKEIDDYLKNASDEEKKVLLQTRIEIVRQLKNLGR
ncbi:DNA primase [Thermosipho atlanticus]|uniref:DNA primase n=1 Tax=Thermosipho atlanticus DSM 15807 TaxID=1123380 RepID=A0A1M5RPP2_9BACT|nr:DNA primase [Thermosipho atlanticus]SHH28275.1 DNA primase [Thermosipho atlanticus DSM 15807]